MGVTMVEISIIIPVYNKVTYLAYMLNDVVEQTFSDFECILIDDGSSDGSGKICDSFAERDRRFKVIHIENQGVSHARNLGISSSKGKYITFLDADDRIESVYLETLYHDIICEDVDLVIANLKKVWSDGKKEILELPYLGKYRFKDLLNDFAKIQYKTGIYGYCVAKLFKEELIDEIKFDETIRLAEDLDFYLSLYPRVKFIYFEEKAIYSYVQNTVNSTSLISDDSIDYYTQLKVQLKLYKMVTELDNQDNDGMFLINHRIYDYVYFCLRHCRINDVDEIIRQINNLKLPKEIKKKDRSLTHKIFLWLYEKKNSNLIRMMKYILVLKRKMRC